MKPLTVHEAKTHLSRLLKAVENGDEVIIERRNAGGTVSRFALVPAPPPERPSLFGALDGQFRMLSDEEWAESDRAVLELFDEAAQHPLSPG